jgi:polygalacturonase
MGSAERTPIKSGRDTDGRRLNRPAENYTITNCTMLSGHGGVVIGSEMSGGVRNITIANCVFDGTDRGIRLKTTRGRGGVVENVRVSNIVMRNIREQAIHLNMVYTRTNPEPVSERTPVFRNMHFAGLTGDARAACEVIGLEEMPVQNITFTDIQLEARTGFNVSQARDIAFRNVRINPQTGPLLTATQTEDLDISGLSTAAPRPAGTPLIDLGAGVKRVFIHDCAPPVGTDLFVRAQEPGEVTLEANRLSGVATPLGRR